MTNIKKIENLLLECTEREQTRFNELFPEHPDLSPKEARDAVALLERTIHSRINSKPNRWAAYLKERSGD